MKSYYLYDASQLLQQNLNELQEIIQANETSGRSHHTLYDLREALMVTERQLHQHVHSMLDNDSRVFRNAEEQSLLSLVELLRLQEEKRKRYNDCSNNTLPSADVPFVYYPTRNATDSLMFRLIVVLQLCVVRIVDARYILTNIRKKEDSSFLQGRDSVIMAPLMLGATWVLFKLPTHKLIQWSDNKLLSRPRLFDPADWTALASILTQAGFAAMSAYWLKQKWGMLWLTTKLAKTTDDLGAWNRQWFMVQSTPGVQSPPGVSRTNNEEEGGNAQDSTKSRRLIEYALKATPKVSLWHSQGELRFLMLKRAMDVFYASVDTAMQVTKGTAEADTATWQITLTTAAVASFYNLTGARKRAEEATSSSERARYLIQHAWGMVSLPALKTISLQASKLLKGASVADRIEVAGVPCFVLSRDPAPELAAAIRRYHCKSGQKGTMNKLSTIDEQEETAPPPCTSNKKPFARSNTRYRQRDIILHLTGGGFFAHIIASDLPFLLDWSASTGACVICPEYSLLPEHTFPDALLEVEAVYRALQSHEGVHALGFEPNRIILTGESAGGNLAAALCVKLGMDATGIPTCLSKNPGEGTGTTPVVAPKESCVPCALVLSCPVLNLSMEMSYSRVVGSDDPVLPRGLISAISNAYGAGIDKRDPLVSPYFAADSVLERFPPTLFFASSNDPLLDDAVALNQRLRSLGVESYLRAAQNLPHAYLGLGTAGFPEAQEVQRQLIDWLNFQLHRDDSSERSNT